MISTTSQILHDGVRNVVVQLTGISDGTGQETNVVKIDASELNPPADSGLKIKRVRYAVVGGVVQLSWAADDPQPFLNLAISDEFDYAKIGGLKNGGGDTANGDILLSTIGFELNSSYSITLEMVKS